MFIRTARMSLPHTRWRARSRPREAALPFATRRAHRQLPAIDVLTDMFYS